MYNNIKMLNGIDVVEWMATTSSAKKYKQMSSKALKNFVKKIIDNESTFYNEAIYTFLDEIKLRSF